MKDFKVGSRELGRNEHDYAGKIDDVLTSSSKYLLYEILIYTPRCLLLKNKSWFTFSFLSLQSLWQQAYNNFHLEPRFTISDSCKRKENNNQYKNRKSSEETHHL